MAVDPKPVPDPAEELDKQFLDIFPECDDDAEQRAEVQQYVEQHIIGLHTAAEQRLNQNKMAG